MALVAGFCAIGKTLPLPTKVATEEAEEELTAVALNIAEEQGEKAAKKASEAVLN